MTRATVASVASFFVSRVDTEADKRLDEIGGHDELKGKLAIANAKLAYQTYREVFMTPEWEALEAKGATKQRCLWASTSTKNPEYKRHGLRRGAGRARHRQHDAARARRGGRWTTARSAATRCSRTPRRRAGSSTRSSPPACPTTRSCRCWRSEGVEKFAKSFADLIEGLESKLKLVTA